jgi:hypothetical protein
MTDADWVLLFMTLWAWLQVRYLADIKAGVEKTNELLRWIGRDIHRHSERVAPSATGNLEPPL